MEIELQSIKKNGHQIENLKNAANQLSTKSILVSDTDKVSSLYSAAYYNLKTSLLLLPKNNFLPCGSLYPTVNSSKHLFIYTDFIRKILYIKNLIAESPTFKTFIDNWITNVLKLLNTLFSYNCKNIFVQYLEKTDLLFRSDNKTNFCGWKMLQTTTI